VVVGFLIEGLAFLGLLFALVAGFWLLIWSLMV